jgi:large subunit ribosomal protein L23
MNQNKYTILASPLITEKATFVNEVGNQVVFKVHPLANKIAIKNAVEQLFQVKVSQVRTLQCMGKKRRVGRSIGRKPAWKKAYVTLAGGDRIDFFGGA